MDSPMCNCTSEACASKSAVADLDNNNIAELGQTRVRRAHPGMTKIYLAGPDVFLPDAVDIGRRKVELCARHGLTGLYPLDSATDPAASDVSIRIFRGNQAMMIEADAVIANLTPFRGPGADAGTVYELGYMAGRGKLCLGYSNDPSPYADRVRKFTEVNLRDGRLVDA